MILQKIRQHTPSLILKLYQRRLDDKNANITDEEFYEAHEELELKIKFLEYKFDRLIDQQLMLQRLINKDDLYVSKSKNS